MSPKILSAASCSKDTPKALRTLQHCHNLLPPAETSQCLVQTRVVPAPRKASPREQSWQPSTGSQSTAGLHLPQHEAQTIGLSPANTRHKGRNVRRGPGSGSPSARTGCGPLLWMSQGGVGGNQSQASADLGVIYTLAAVIQLQI